MLVYEQTKSCEPTSEIHSAETFTMRISTIRMIRVGGMSKQDLLRELRRCNIQLNKAAQTLFADERFITSTTVAYFETIELTVANFDFAQGATTAQLFAAAIARGFSLCPLELGPHFRLQYLDQPEGFWGHPQTQHQAPPGSLTIASAPLTDDNAFPKGFYLRRIQGELWLRGYHAGAEHVWNPNDHFLFCRAVEL